MTKEFQVSYYESNETVVTEKDTDLYQCYYQGSVRKFPGSQVSASTCSGLSALIIFSNQTYIIEHIEGDEAGRHVSYRTEDLSRVWTRCEIKHSFQELSVTDHFHSPRRVKRDILSETKYLEEVLVADKALLTKHGSREATVRQLLSVANTLDLYFRPLNVRVATVGVHVWEVDPIRVDADASLTLTRFLIWRIFRLNIGIANDNAQLLVGRTFQNGTDGASTIRSICIESRSAGVNSANSDDLSRIVATVAHSMGHNLGMLHDDGRTCACPQPSCLMKAVKSAPWPVSYSSCSQNDFETFLLHEHGVCLRNQPDFHKLVGGPVCGNMFTEKDEQCDCGQPSECEDACCEAATCKLKPGAQCSSTELCCEDCKFLPLGTVCRSLSSECDLEEYCYGNSSHCPDNVYLKDGYECKNGTFYCSAGACLSADSMCEEMWGTGAKSAEDICYSALNGKGDAFGHCGRDQYDQFQGCSPWDVKCGKVQCDGGEAHPLQMETAVVKTVNVSVMDVNFECKTAHIMMTDFTISEIVQEGTKCGEHKVCNNYNHCHCELGWDPPFCDIEGVGGSVDSGPMMEIIPGEHDSNSMGAAALAPILTMSIITYVVTKYLEKKKVICTKPSAASPDIPMTCHVRTLDGKSTSLGDSHLHTAV